MYLLSTRLEILELLAETYGLVYGLSLDKNELQRRSNLVITSSSLTGLICLLKCLHNTQRYFYFQAYLPLNLLHECNDEKNIHLSNNLFSVDSTSILNLTPYKNTKLNGLDLIFQSLCDLIYFKTEEFSSTTKCVYYTGKDIILTLSLKEFILDHLDLDEQQFTCLQHFKSFWHENTIIKLIFLTLNHTIMFHDIFKDINIHTTTIHELTLLIKNTLHSSKNTPLHKYYDAINNFFSSHLLYKYENNKTSFFKFGTNVHKSPLITTRQHTSYTYTSDSSNYFFNINKLTPSYNNLKPSHTIM